MATVEYNGVTKLGLNNHVFIETEESTVTLDLRWSR